jgi:hypothetical protein
MNQPASASLKVAYCVVLLGAVLPFGLAKSGWVALATGGMGVVPVVGPLAFLALGLYRVFLVARGQGALDSQPAQGVASVLSAIGKVLLYLGALVVALGWISGPLMHAFIHGRTDAGAAYFVVGLYLSLAGGIGTLGLLLFEFSRLLGFERGAARAAQAQPSRK